MFRNFNSESIRSTYGCSSFNVSLKPIKKKIQFYFEGQKVAAGSVSLLVTDERFNFLEQNFDQMNLQKVDHQQVFYQTLLRLINAIRTWQTQFATAEQFRQRHVRFHCISDATDEVL